MDPLMERAQRARDHLWSLIGTEPQVEQIGVGHATDRGADGHGLVLRVTVVDGGGAEPAIPVSVDGFAVVVIRAQLPARPEPTTPSRDEPS